MLSSSLQHDFPILGEAVVENVCGCDQRSLLIGPPELSRAKLYLELAHIGYRRIGGVEWAVSG